MDPLASKLLENASIVTLAITLLIFAGRLILRLLDKIQDLNDQISINKTECAAEISKEKDSKFEYAERSRKKMLELLVEIVPLLEQNTNNTNNITNNSGKQCDLDKEKHNKQDKYNKHDNME